MYLLLIVMTFIGLGNRILAAVVTNKSKNRCFIRARTWVCRHISTPALMGYRHVQPWSFLSIPTRLEGILIAVYCLINLVSAFVCYEVFEDNMFFYHREDLQYARYFADRTGIMSFFNMVLLWVLAGRNDMVIWLTGWSYRRCLFFRTNPESMNLFHRWTARVATIQAIAHSIAYSYIKYGYLWEMTFSQTWSVWATGVYSTIVMSLILPLSIRTLRTRQYEVFLAIHIVMSILLLVFLYLHVLPLGFEATVIICFGIWVLDRLFRILRVVYLSFNTLKTQNAIAEVTANDPSLLRLRVTASVRLNPSPGDYYFLYSKWWPENHPFTLASWNPTPDGSATELHFLIAPMAGWTRRLRNRSEEGSKTTILLEGPYGHPRDLAAYDNVLLLAGGSGIASILPYVSTLRDKARVTLVWTVRNADYAADVLDNELAEANTGHVDIHVYFTQQNLDEARAVLDKSHGGRLTLCPGRPNVRSALDESIASLGKGRLAVLACGPAMMMDDTRRQVAKSYGTWLGTVEAGRLEYFEESFTW